MQIEKFHISLATLFDFANTCFVKLLFASVNSDDFWSPVEDSPITKPKVSHSTCTEQGIAVTLSTKLYVGLPCTKY